MSTPDTPASQPPNPPPSSEPGDRRPGEDLGRRQEQLIDEALEETFPASDPIAPKHIEAPQGGG